MGDEGTGSCCLLIPQTQQVPLSEMKTQLLLGKRGSVSSGFSLLTVGQKRERRCRTLISGVDLCGLQDPLIELDRGFMHRQR
jgi:hypothetical protein